jgi:MYXO-CTERM domain-containing protein
MGKALLVSLVAIAAAGSMAHADERPDRLPIGQGRRISIPYTGPARPVPAQTSQYIYMNRCKGGCSLTHGSDDARALISSIAMNGVVGEFQNDQGQTGAAADAAWTALVTCVQEVYSPFAVTVSDQLPINGVGYTMAIAAGQPGDIGLDVGILGVGLGTCTPLDNVISFSFANHEGGTGLTRMLDTCWTIAQETAHNFGLEHEYRFTDGQSACNDPMTYRTDCGGQKFFRNKPAECGENVARLCNCGGTQNSVVRLTKTLGAGTSSIPAPSIVLSSPAMGSSVQSGFAVHGQAGSRRGVAKVELYLNNHLWATAPGATFLVSGQPNPSDYLVTAPANVPDGVIDVQLKAYDDLDNKSDSAVVTVQKGASCTSAASCLTGQKCDAGKCYWDAPIGMLGDVCTYNEFCTTGLCQQSDIGQYCTQACVVGSTDGCPATFDCIATSETAGVCLPQSTSSAGCCSVGHGDNHLPWAPIGLGVVALGFVLRRRRR